MFNRYRSAAVYKLLGVFTQAEGICRSLDIHNHKQLLIYDVSLRLNLTVPLSNLTYCTVSQPPPPYSFSLQAYYPMNHVPGFLAPVYWLLVAKIGKLQRLLSISVSLALSGQVSLGSSLF